MLGKLGPWACHLAGVQHLLERPRREAQVGDQRFNPRRLHFTHLHIYANTYLRITYFSMHHSKYESSKVNK